MQNYSQVCSGICSLRFTAVNILCIVLQIVPAERWFLDHRKLGPRLFLRISYDLWVTLDTRFASKRKRKQAVVEVCAISKIVKRAALKMQF